MNRDTGGRGGPQRGQGAAGGADTVLARLSLTAGALAGLAGVLSGAFGAHALRARLAPEMLALWQTAVQYHFWHALALVAVGLLALARPVSRQLRWSGGLFALGLVLFSGSLYLLAATGVRWLGMITPFGGLAWLGAWALLAWCAWR